VTEILFEVGVNVKLEFERSGEASAAGVSDIGVFVVDLFGTNAC